MLNRVYIFRETCSISLRRFPKYIASKSTSIGRLNDTDILADFYFRHHICVLGRVRILARIHYIMKGKFWNFRKKGQKVSLHLKRKLNDLKNAKYFDFSKMDIYFCPFLGFQKSPYWQKFSFLSLDLYRLNRDYNKKFYH